MRQRDRQRRRPTRRHAFRPGAEGLEPRIALSGTANQVGVNVDVNHWGANNPIWTDLHNLTTGWTPASGTSLSLTADGYPLANASTFFVDVNYPSGVYQFSYTGGGTVSFSGSAHLSGSVTVANGVTSGRLDVDTSAGAYIHMQVTNVSASNPMHNFHLMMPGYGNGTTPVRMFTPAFINALKPFSDIRFVDWDRADDTTLSNWSQRVPANAFKTDAPGSPPYEDMIELCNEAQKDMWINIPPLATPQYVQSLAQLIHSKLDPNLNVYVEYANEVWNGSFPAYGPVAKLAASNPAINHSASQYQQVAQESAYNLVSDGQIFKQVFGSAASRVRPVLGAQAVYDLFEVFELQFINQYFGAPSEFVYAVGEAPYMIATNQNASGLTLDQLFSNMESWLNGTLIPAIELDYSVAKQYGVGMVAYEGGQSLVPGANNPNYNVMLRAQTDPRMGQLYTQLEKAWQQAGGGLFNWYTLSGGNSQYGFWNLIPNVTVAGSTKYDGILAAVYPTADANTDGMVDYGDFQIIAAHYGDSHAFWRTGDTNADRVVNWKDLNTLRQHLNPAGFTLAQFAQQALFQPSTTVNSPTAVEYDGYGIAYAGGLARSATSGTVAVNTTASGQPITLGGVPYPKGLGFSGNASTTIALNGRYARFDSTIGVDSSGSSSSSVIFQVYGDNKLLYQSGARTSGSAGVPIDVNVAGVKNLTLVVEAAPGSTASLDHGVWADARLVSTANFGGTQPYTMTWKVSRNGTVISTQTADSFVLPAVSGTYNLSLTVKNASGSQATATTTVTVAPITPSATATFVGTNTTAKGNWIGTFGSQGYDLVGSAAKLPAYAKVTPVGAKAKVWAASTTDPRALQNPSGSGRTATVWYASPGYRVDLDLTDGQAHDVALYFFNELANWAPGKTETVQVINAATGAVLDTRTLTAAQMNAGTYLRWKLSGHVVFKLTATAPQNALLSGLFFDPAS